MKVIVKLNYIKLKIKTFEIIGGLKMESNISRDHIALEAMKCIMQTARRRRAIWNRILTQFFPNKEKSDLNYCFEKQAKAAYEIADAMIKERNKNKEE